MCVDSSHQQSQQAQQRMCALFGPLCTTGGGHLCTPLGAVFHVFVIICSFASCFLIICWLLLLGLFFGKVSSISSIKEIQSRLRIHSRSDVIRY